jgi:hypothetical protein
MLAVLLAMTIALYVKLHLEFQTHLPHHHVLQTGTADTWKTLEIHSHMSQQAMSHTVQMALLV